MVKLNDHIFYYLPVHKIRRGGLGCTIIIVRGKKAQYQIDVSTNSGPIPEDIFRQMKTDGIDPQQTNAIFMTHCHPDHLRGLPFWIKKIGQEIPVYTQPNGTFYIQNQTYYLTELNDFLGDFRKNVSHLPQGLSVLATNLIWGPPSTYENFQAHHNGQIFDAGGVTLKTIYTTGHCRDHTSYLVECDGKSFLMSGDMISFKDMHDGKGIIPLASFNTPLSQFKEEIISLNYFVENPPDVLLTAHYGLFESKEKIKSHFKAAIEEGEMLWNRTLLILRTEGPQAFKTLTKKVINFPKYLSGVATRTSSMYVILTEMQRENLVKCISMDPPIYAIKTV